MVTVDEFECGIAVPSDEPGVVLSDRDGRVLLGICGRRGKLRSESAAQTSAVLICALGDLRSALDFAEACSKTGVDLSAAIVMIMIYGGIYTA